MMTATEIANLEYALAADAAFRAADAADAAIVASAVAKEAWKAADEAAEWRAGATDAAADAVWAAYWAAWAARDVAWAAAEAAWRVDATEAGNAAAADYAADELGARATSAQVATAVRLAQTRWEGYRMEAHRHAAT